MITVGYDERVSFLEAASDKQHRCQGFAFPNILQVVGDMRVILVEQRQGGGSQQVLCRSLDRSSFLQAID